MPKYILIETENNGTFFKTDKEGVRHYFEIYKLSIEQENELVINNDLIIVEASNQTSALKEIIKKHNIFKDVNKSFYEKNLPLKV